MGKLKSKVGTAILGAAVIDDILGIVVLTILTALTDPSVKPVGLNTDGSEEQRREQHVAEHVGLACDIVAHISQRAEDDAGKIIGCGLGAKLIANEDWVVVVGHHPIYAYTTKAEYERMDMQKNVMPILHKYNNVAIYACGHIHNFQHIRMKNDNIDYVVNSSASLARPVKETEGTVFCSSADGFSIISATKNVLRMSMIDKDGKVIHTVEKVKK